MKVEIRYTYKQDQAYPFVAAAYVDDKFFDIKVGESFKQAKEELLLQVKEKLNRIVPEIPKSEEVEL